MTAPRDDDALARAVEAVSPGEIESVMEELQRALDECRAKINLHKRRLRTRGPAVDPAHSP